MPAPEPVTVELNFDRGTLWAASDSGNVRAYHGTEVTWVADFPFSIESTNLSGSTPGPDKTVTVRDSITGKFQFTFTLNAGPPSAPAPSYKYTIRGLEGPAKGKVLDPIIIVDRR